MKKIRTIALVLGVVSTLVVIIGALLPRQWDVRVSVISPTANPERVYENINDFKNWNNWAVWKDMDPEYMSEFSDPSVGVGAWQKWSSPKSGRGQLWMTAADPNKGIEYEGAIESGGEKNAAGSITFSPSVEGRGLELVWADKGTLPPIIGGYFRVMVQKSLEEHFRRGLERLAEISSSGSVEAKIEAPKAVPASK